MPLDLHPKAHRAAAFPAIRHARRGDRSRLAQAPWPIHSVAADAEELRRQHQVGLRADRSRALLFSPRKQARRVKRRRRTRRDVCGDDRALSRGTASSTRPRISRRGIGSGSSSCSIAWRVVEAEGASPCSAPKRAGESPATRSPHRLNSIGGPSAVRLVGVEGLTLRIRESDILDGSPVLDREAVRPLCRQPSRRPAPGGLHPSPIRSPPTPVSLERRRARRPSSSSRAASICAPRRGAPSRWAPRRTPTGGSVEGNDAERRGDQLVVKDQRPTGGLAVELRVILVTWSHQGIAPRELALSRLSDLGARALPSPSVQGVPRALRRTLVSSMSGRISTKPAARAIKTSPSSSTRSWRRATIKGASDIHLEPKRGAAMLVRLLGSTAPMVEDAAFAGGDGRGAGRLPGEGARADGTSPSAASSGRAAHRRRPCRARASTFAPRASRASSERRSSCGSSSAKSSLASTSSGSTRKSALRVREIVRRPAERARRHQGPSTGSGKTSTLYSFMQLLDTARVNVMTLEDPVEVDIAVDQRRGTHTCGRASPSPRSLRAIPRKTWT